VLLTVRDFHISIPRRKGPGRRSPVCGAPQLSSLVAAAQDLICCGRKRKRPRHVAFLMPSALELEMCRYQGEHVATITRRLHLPAAWVEVLFSTDRTAAPSAT
jgi:hypothetical protein